VAQLFSLGVIHTMKTLILILLVWPALAYDEDTNNPGRIQKGEIWWSDSRLERIAKDYVKQHNIEFAFTNTKRVVVIETRGTNSVAKIWFSSGMEPTLLVEIAQSGEVITNHLGIAVCRTGRTP
jgi:hypothetical protein